MSALLEVRSVTAGYGDFQALFDVSLEVEEGELLALVGANGAGKSTILRTMTGTLSPMTGSVWFDGEDVTSLGDDARARRGISLVPEGRRMFPSLTIEENLRVGAATRRTGPWDLDAVFDMIPLLRDRRRRPAATLSGGEQQAVAIGRALMGNPRVLLMDEVSLGLAPVVVEQIYESLPSIRAGGITVVLVEQDLSRSFAVADEMACILEGRVALRGPVKSLTRDEVTAAYFGTSTEGAS
ncbi:MAG: ABC transporter ATP-binding protein [Nocardioides sp.]|uniref:ABC transporter ATP-binding protein n=1 Tax=Nocardioides sp. TaxID=35761 RepID=UPI003264DC40